MADWPAAGEGAATAEAISSGEMTLRRLRARLVPNVAETDVGPEARRVAAMRFGSLRITVLGKSAVDFPGG